ncbi:MAG: hypothetical protein R3F59_27365 [Myxococcota bacterium]
MVWLLQGLLGCEPGEVTALDLGCGDAGRLVVATGAREGSDRGVAVRREPDGTTLLFGTVDDPLPEDSIQEAWLASVRLDDSCAVDPAYGAGGLAWLVASDPDSAPESLGAVVAAEDGGSALYGVAAAPYPLDDGTVASFPAAFATAVDRDGAPLGGLAARHVVAPGQPYPEDLELRGVAARPDGNVQLLTESWSGPALLATDGVAVDEALAWLALDATRVEGLAVLDDGAIVIGGTFPDAGAVPGLIRLAADGAVDTAFGTAGVAGVGTGGDVESRTSVAALPDGRLLLAGVVDLDGGYQALGVIRFAADGAVDRTFGDNGVARIDLGALGHANHHALQVLAVASDGAILLGGDVDDLDDPSGPRIGAARLLPDGDLDPSFADGGVFTADTADETLGGLDAATDGVVTLIATHAVSDRVGEWVVYRLAPGAQGQAVR